MTDSRPPYRVQEPGALDAAIDRAVRDLMSREPRPGLRHRVLARLERPARPHPALRSLALGTSMVALLVLAVILLRPSDQPAVQAPAQAPQVATGRPPAAPPAQLPVAEPHTPAAATRPAAEPRITRVPLKMPPVANVFGERTDRAHAAAAVAEEVVFTEPAAGVVAGSVGPTPPAIVISAIEIAPLQVSPIRVEPLPAAQMKERR